MQGSMFLLGASPILKRKVVFVNIGLYQLSWARTVCCPEVLQQGGLTVLRMQTLLWWRGHLVLIQYQINVNQEQNGEGLEKWGR